ncbi:metallophosphoesterase [Bremerella cremea]|uniref:metallophosphoesterase n=1 Tax=Bremerella cremea TaxID=1031537 RepID=UPI0031E8EFEE
MSVAPSVAQMTVDCYRKAGQILRGSSLRNGNVVCLDRDNSDDVMVTADLHGNRTNFRRILEIADLENHPRRHLVFQEVCHGGPTYPKAGGCMSHLMLEDIAKLVIQFPNQVHFLISNHELAELTDFPIMKAGKMLNLMFRCGMGQMYGDAVPMIRAAQLEFLGSLPIAIRIGERLMVTHSLPKGCDADPFDITIFDREINAHDRACGGSLHRLVWGRDFRQENVDYLAQQLGIDLFITGHEPCQYGFSSPNSRQIVLDCCSRLGKYLMIPMADELTQDDLLNRIHSLHAPVLETIS